MYNSASTKCSCRNTSSILQLPPKRAPRPYAATGQRGYDATDSATLSLGSACGPVIVPVFKTGGRQVFLSPMGSTPIRFRHLFSMS
jgi:hypothetical protein